MHAPLTIKVILGSTREGRFSEKPGAWIASLLTAAGHQVEVLDLRDYALPFFAEPVSPSYKQEQYANPAVERWRLKIAEADAFVIVAPEYNHAYPAVLKNALDYVYQEWNRKPVAFVGYGSAGGARSVEQLRLVAVELNMAPVRHAVHMPYDVIVSAQKGSTDAEIFAPFASRASEMITELAWWARALAAARAAVA